MKRLHIHVSVENIDQSVRFYSILFAAEPTMLKPDYAKWMLEDPRVNFAISKRGGAAGVEHLGIQAADEAELEEVYSRLASAERPIVEEKATTCCYANSDKQWIADPQGIPWETFLTHGESTVYGHSGAIEKLEDACCEPASMARMAEPTKASGCCGVANGQEAEAAPKSSCGCSVTPGA